MQRLIPRHGRHYGWVFSQFHTKTVFSIVQIFIFIYSVFALFCLTNFIPYCYPSNLTMRKYIFFLAITNVICVLIGFMGMRCAEQVHRLGSRPWKYCAFPPVVLLFPSYVSQLGNLTLLAIWTCWSLYGRISTFNISEMSASDIWNQIVMCLAVPIVLVWFIVLYLFIASLDFFFYTARKSRYWHCKMPAPVILTSRSCTLEDEGGSRSSWSGRSAHNLKVAKSGAFENSEAVKESPLRALRSRPETAHHETALSAFLACQLDRSSSDSPPNSEENIDAALLGPPDLRTSAPDCASVLKKACVSPLKRQLDTVDEESKSQVSGEV